MGEVLCLGEGTTLKKDWGVWCEKGAEIEMRTRVGMEASFGT